MNTAANLNGSTPGRSATTGACAAHGLHPWRRMLANAVLFVIAFLMASCSGQIGPDYLSNLDADLKFYADTAVMVNPGSAEIRRGQQVTTVVTSRHKGLMPRNMAMSAVDPRLPGVRIEVTPTAPSRPCVGNELPVGEDPSQHFCHDWRVTVSADAPATAIGRITLSVQWGGDGGRTIERLAYFDVGLIGVPAPPGFDLGVVPVAKVYATTGFVEVTIRRNFGFAEPVTLSLDGFASNITGTFSQNPVPVGVDTVQLRLHLPASLASGTFTQLKVLGSGGGIDSSWQFGQLVEPLYTVRLATADGGPAVLTPTRPLDLEVTLEFDPFGPFSLIGPGRIELSLPDPPPGVMASFLPDAQLSSFNPAQLVLRRTLRLSGPRDASMGDLRVRATAVGLPPDTAGVQPFVEAKLPLRLDPSLSWDYVNSGAAYFLNANDAIGIGMQNNNQPVIAWLEGPSGGNKEVFVKRFDGTTFAPSPSPGGLGSGLSAVGGRMEQARMAMAGNGDAHVAFTYKLNEQEGARVGYGLNRAGANWAAHNEVIFLPSAQHARSPRIAASLNDALALAYLVETGIPAGAGGLFVRSRLAAGALAALPGPQLDGSINVSTSGQVLRDTPSLALRVDGNPWLAWIEERFAPQVPLPPALWLRGHDGTRWGAPIAVPRLRPLVAVPTQLLVTQSGRLIVAWLEASPARLMLASVDPATGVATELRDSINPDGALNITTDEPARDMALTLDVRGRLVVTWTEGLTRPLLYAKRLNASGSWDRLGSAIDAFRPTRSPFVTSDGSGRLYVAWTGFFGFTDLDSPAPRTDVLVGRWIFTEDFAR